MTLARIAAAVLLLAACGAADRTPPAGGEAPAGAAARDPGTPIAGSGLPIAGSDAPIAGSGAPTAGPGATIAVAPPERKVSAPIPAPTDAPHALACKAHDECAVVPVLPAADACCDVTVTAAPVTRAYLEFMTTWRRGACPAGHVCAPNDLPGAQMAPACYVGRCVAGACDLACNDPTFDPQTAPGMPPR